MQFAFEDQPSDTPFVERIWRARPEREGDFTSIAASLWEIVITSYAGKVMLTVRGPKTSRPRCVRRRKASG
jgi:hypothetical protein